MYIKMYMIIHIHIYGIPRHKRHEKSHFCLKNVTLGRKGTVIEGSASSRLSVGGGPG